MKKTAIATTVFILILAAAPFIAFADHASINSKVFLPTILNGPLLVCVGSTNNNNTGGNTLPPCNNVCDLVAQIANIIYFMIGVVIWIVTPVLIATAGIMYMLGGPNPEMVGRAKKTITGAVWGIVIVLCAWLLVSTFVTFLNIKGIGGFGLSSCDLSGNTQVPLQYFGQPQ